MFKLCFFLVCLSLARSELTPCADGSNKANISKFCINDCHEATNKCTIYTNANNVIQITFVPAVPVNNLYPTSSITYNNQVMSLQAGPKNWCDNANVCPIKAGQNVTITQNEPVNNNLTGDGKVSFELQCDNNQTIICVDFDVVFAKK